MPTMVLYYLHHSYIHCLGSFVFYITLIFFAETLANAGDQGSISPVTKRKTSFRYVVQKETHTRVFCLSEMAFSFCVLGAWELHS